MSKEPLLHAICKFDHVAKESNECECVSRYVYTRANNTIFEGKGKYLKIIIVAL